MIITKKILKLNRIGKPRDDHQTTKSILLDFMTFGLSMINKNKKKRLAKQNKNYFV